MIDAIEELLKFDTVGDPMRDLRWTRKTPGKIATCLSPEIRISSPTVSRLMKTMKFSLHVNRKMVSSPTTLSRKDRDLQFQKIREIRERFESHGWPIISVDAKKKELIGLFRNPGASYSREARAVKEKDFPSEADGKGLPYGIYDPIQNYGYVNVGTSHDTPQFAVNSIDRWWQQIGKALYPNKNRLLILADSGGSNGATPRLWKRSIQDILCNQHGLIVTVAHYPSGASKWNPIEHRLFGQISINWAGIPLENYAIMLNYIRSTKTTTGLRVNAELDERNYPTGIKVTDEQMMQLSIVNSEVHPKWNYTISPNL